MKISLSAIVIIVVTLFSLLTGLVITDLSVRINRTRDEISVHQFSVDKIEEKSRFLKDLDGELSREATNLINEAAVIALEYWALENIGTGLTTNELLQYQLDFANKVGNANGLIESTVIVGEVHLRFANNATTTEYELATREKEGYDYIVTRDTWDLYKPVRTVEKNQFLSDYMGLELILDEITLLTDNLDALTDNPPFVFYEMNWDNINQLYAKPLQDEIEKQQINEKLAGTYESQADLMIRIIAVIIAVLILVTVSIRLVDNSNLDNNSSNSKIGYDSSAAKGKKISRHLSMVMSNRDELIGLGQFLVVIITVLSLITPAVLVIITQ